MGELYIHELGDFSGSLSDSDFFIIDDGTQSFKLNVDKIIEAIFSKSPTYTSTITDIIDVNSSNAVINSANFTQYGKIAQLHATWTNVNDISVPASGNITNIPIGTLVNGKRPNVGRLAISNGDIAGQAWYTVLADGTIDLSAVEGTGVTRTISAGTTFYLFGMYILP